MLIARVYQTSVFLLRINYGKSIKKRLVSVLYSARSSLVNVSVLLFPFNFPYGPSSATNREQSVITRRLLLIQTRNPFRIRQPHRPPSARFENMGTFHSNHAAAAKYFRKQQFRVVSAL